MLGVLLSMLFMKKESPLRWRYLSLRAVDSCMPVTSGGTACFGQDWSCR